MAIDCIPHASGHLLAHVHHLARIHHHPKPLAPTAIKAATKPRVVRHHVRLRECPPGAFIAPLADLDNDNVAEIYMLPYESAPAAGDRAATTGPPGATPAEASGLDLPSGGLSDIGSMDGGPGSSSGLPTGSGGGGAGSGGSSGGLSGPGGGGSGGGGAGSGSASGAGGSTGGGGSTSTGGGSSGAGGSPGTGSGVVGGGGGTGPVVVIPPTTGGGSLPTGGGDSGGGAVLGVPEPSTWALMLIGFGAAGATLRCRAANSRARNPFASSD